MMPQRPCLGSDLHPVGHVLVARGSRCEPCRKRVDNRRAARRGTTAERGLTGEHAAMSRGLRGERCVICGEYGTADDPVTAGHILARSRGGTNDPSNYQPEHRSCGSRKGTGLG